MAIKTVTYLRDASPYFVGDVTGIEEGDRLDALLKQGYVRLGDLTDNMPPSESYLGSDPYPPGIVYDGERTMALDGAVARPQGSGSDPVVREIAGEAPKVNEPADDGKPKAIPGAPTSRPGVTAPAPKPAE